MKRTLLAFGFLALGSLSLHAASACVNGTLAQLNALNPGGCTITNGSNTWTLNHWVASGPGFPTGQNINGTPVTPNDLNISFALWGLGFKVTTAYSGGPITVTTEQSATLEINYRIIDGNSGTGLLTNFGATLDYRGSQDFVPTAETNGAAPQAQLFKYVQGLTAQPFVEQILGANYVNPPSSAQDFRPQDFALNAALIAPNIGPLIVVDKLVMTGGPRPGASATVASFTNYFAPSANPEIPEPMTFALMGAGLVGLAILRRRKQ